MKSALYVGSVRHRRFTPKVHKFSYFMAFFYLDLAEVDKIFSVPFLFAKRRSLLAFRRKDYFGDDAKPLDLCIRDLVESRTSHRPTGPIRVLTQISYLGFCFNPVSFYYCFNAEDSRIEYIVADVSNTPWNERHAYVVECALGVPLKFEVPKVMHVSPFMPLAMTYRWQFSEPGKSHQVHMENFSTGAALDAGVVFDATMALKRRELSGFQVLRTLAAFPFLTFKAIAAIYFEAIVLKLKGLKFFHHPQGGQAQ
jgi:DUF1365 family protein